MAYVLDGLDDHSGRHFGQPATVVAPDTIGRIVGRAAQLIPQADRLGVRMSKHQKSRIACWTALLLKPEADDRFVTGQTVLDYRNDRSQRLPTFSRATQWLLPEFNVRRGIILTDVQILQQLVRIDELIIQGRSKINSEFAQMGAAVDVRVQELRSWMADRERNPTSIYHCYYKDSRS